MSNHLTGTPADVAEQREAISRAMGYPVRGIPRVNGVNMTGDPYYDQLPKVYAGPGTPGWLEYRPEIVVSDDGTVASIEVTPRAEAHLGKTVQIAGGKSVPIKARADLLTKQELPAKIRDVIARRDLERAVGIEGRPDARGGGR